VDDHAHISLAHDWLVGLRGGEWVLDRLARLFGPTELYTLVNDGRFLTDAIARCRVITSPLQRFPGAAGKWRRHYLPLMPWAVERIKVRTCDLLISTSSAVMKSIRPPPSVPHLCYCHSPARYVWEQSDDYALGEGGLMRAWGLKAVRERFQGWDRRTASRVTRFLANSAHTAARIKRCFERDSQVVYPPVRTQFFTIDSSITREDWLLVVAALEPYKRTDIAIEASKQCAMRLKIAGEGSQRAALQAMAGPNVEFLGRVSDETLRNLYRRAKALIFPQTEDFGIIAAEAQATGCPVLAYASGGAREIVVGETGVLFDDQSPQQIVQALRRLESNPVDPGACRRSALRFSEDAFDQAVMGHVEELLQGSGKSRAC
jgi:glycosyltransferase involved in cell wall biosynthesis